MDAIDTNPIIGDSRMKPIAYEPHPVTAERKAELIADGYKIIDIRFKPAETKEIAEDAPKRTRKQKHESVAATGD